MFTDVDHCSRCSCGLTERYCVVLQTLATPAALSATVRFRLHAGNGGL